MGSSGQLRPEGQEEGAVSLTPIDVPGEGGPDGSCVLGGFGTANPTERELG